VQHGGKQAAARGKAVQRQSLGKQAPRAATRAESEGPIAHVFGRLILSISLLFIMEMCKNSLSNTL
jgi:hypothetical protein